MPPNYPSNENVIKITNSNGLEYWAYPLRQTDTDQRKPNSSINPPGARPDSNFLMSLQGMSASISLPFVIWDDGEDKSNGTAPTGEFDNDTVVTVGEQIDYLLKHFHDEGITTTFDVEQMNAYLENRLRGVKTGDISAIRIPRFNPDSAKWVDNCTFEFDIGDK